MTMTLILILALVQQPLTAEESKAVEAVAASVLKAGFPDAKGAAFYSGKVHVRAEFDPDKEPCPLPSHASDFQAGIPDSTKMAYGFTFDGLHVKLKDGTWLLGMTHRFKPRDGDGVKTTDCIEINVAKITAEAAKAHPFDAEKDASKWLDRLAPPHRPRAVKALNLWVPATYHLKLDTDEWAPAAALLHAAGWTDAGVATIVIAGHRARTFWQLRPWSEPEFIFDPGGKYPQAKAREEAWEEANKAVTPEAPAVAFRRALYRWCQAQILAEHPMIAPDIAAAACKAALDPKDPQKHGARIDALLAGSRLPVAPPKDADLAARLGSWEARTRQPRMKVTTKKTDTGASMSTSFETDEPAYVPDKADLDALVALLADERPSRFFDFSGPRTVGDNAWRALATLLEADPRALSGHPTDKLWTAAERKSAAAAFQRWWKEHRDEHVEK